MTWKLGKHEFKSRFILGSGKYSLNLIKAAVENAQADIITLALRRVNDGGMANILDYIPEHITLYLTPLGQKCRRGGADCPLVQRALSQRFGKNRNHAG